MECHHHHESTKNYVVADTSVLEIIPPPPPPAEYLCRCRRLNSKLNAMLSNNVLCDVDVRDLYGLMDEIGVRHQWKEMNAQIHKELEAIGQHVDQSRKILSENPPPQRFWCHRPFFGCEAAAAAAPAEAEKPAEEEIVVEQTVEEEVVQEESVQVEETKVEVEVETKVETKVETEVELKTEEVRAPCCLSQLAWRRWDYMLNSDVASHSVEEIIPLSPADIKIERRLCKEWEVSEWDRLMEDVVAWHRLGLHRFHVRMCMCQFNGQ